jgi:hypothetical protein
MAGHYDSDQLKAESATNLGAPSFALFAKGGAPGDLLHFLPSTTNAPFHIPRLGNGGGRL